MNQRLSFLADFCRLYKSGRFYLAQQKMKTPVFFDGFKGENEYFTKICRKISQNLIEHKYPQGAELFLACEDLAEAHQLSACIFGVETPRHLRSEVEANSQSMNMSAYALEPERKQLKSRSRKGTERSNRSAITDHSEEKKAMRQQILE